MQRAALLPNWSFHTTSILLIEVSRNLGFDRAEQQALANATVAIPGMGGGRSPSHHAGADWCRAVSSG
jgi:hypothetical protein